MLAMVENSISHLSNSFVWFYTCTYHSPNCLNVQVYKYYLGTKKMAEKMYGILVPVMGWNDILLNNSFWKCTAQAECHCVTIYNLELSVKMILCPNMALSRLGTAVCPKGKGNYCVVQEQRY